MGFNPTSIINILTVGASTATFGTIGAVGECLSRKMQPSKLKKISLLANHMLQGLGTSMIGLAIASNYINPAAGAYGLGISLALFVGGPPACYIGHCLTKNRNIKKVLVHVFNGINVITKITNVVMTTLAASLILSPLATAGIGISLTVLNIAALRH
ncbi:MAG: hypothetical protein H0W88_12360 [Parachlamydiaceae bacterium]|nr:hypothetical protein [Parachlamydiaceae bacterium]